MVLRKLLLPAIPGLSGPALSLSQTNFAFLPGSEASPPPCGTVSIDRPVQRWTCLCFFLLPRPQCLPRPEARDGSLTFPRFAGPLIQARLAFSVVSWWTFALLCPYNLFPSRCTAIRAPSNFPEKCGSLLCGNKPGRRSPAVAGNLPVLERLRHPRSCLFLVAPGSRVSVVPRTLTSPLTDQVSVLLPFV